MQNPWGKLVAGLAGSPGRNLAAGVGAGAMTGAVEYLVHATILQEHLPAPLPGVADAAIIAVVTGMLVYIVLREWRMRRALIVEQLRMVAELNHQVRNALQVIVYSQFVPQQEQARTVLMSVDRIDKTLKELFPAIAEPQTTSPKSTRAR